MVMSSQWSQRLICADSSKVLRSSLLRSKAGVVPSLLPLGRGHPSLLGRCVSKRLNRWTHTNTYRSPAKPPQPNPHSNTGLSSPITQTPAEIEWGFRH